jgi:hypothetical protein
MVIRIATHSQHNGNGPARGVANWLTRGKPGNQIARTAKIAGNAKIEKQNPTTDEHGSGESPESHVIADIARHRKNLTTDFTDYTDNLF